MPECDQKYIPHENVFVLNEEKLIDLMKILNIVYNKTGNVIKQKISYI